MEKKWQRILVGVFDIISGVFAFCLVFLLAATLTRLKMPLPPLTVSLSVILGFLAALGILALAGGICAICGKIWGLVLAGSVSASVSLPPLGIPASVVLLLSPKVSGAIRLLIFILFSPLWLSYIGLAALILLSYGL